ncbi:hypothetical protein [Paenibacillus terrae]|uniref:Uncharacterized protein n=1 Tax=Paenibacillus terrae TaxID=159743 RepID=A0A0D7WYY6_9BACL|nr:hypothetical protein [Paenibacillus terrae]KJD44199.1 hypothetical protein QD47_18540 [Paenibacillus terrae]
MQYGVSGFLAPEGTLYECKYGGHRKLAADLVLQYDIRFFDGDSNKMPDFIKFGCSNDAEKEGNGACHVFMWSEPTSEQISWMLENLERMTDVQRRSVLSHLDAFGIDV